MATKRTSLRRSPEIDQMVKDSCGFDSERPKLVDLQFALDLLSKIETTILFDDADEEVNPFDWKAARAVLQHLSQQHPDPDERGKVFLWASQGRQSSRLASAGSHAKFIETPDSEKTEGVMTKKFAINHPILFLLRQEGAKDKGWHDTPFYWPVIRAQQNTPAAIYTAETVD